MSDVDESEDHGNDCHFHSENRLLSSEQNARTVLLAVP